MRNKCDPSEQKQPFGCTLTNPPHVMPLRPGSTFIDGFSRAIYQKIADFNSYPLRYNIENPPITVESGRNGVTCGGFVKVHPNGCFCSEGVTYVGLGLSNETLFFSCVDILVQRICRKCSPM